MIRKIKCVVVCFSFFLLIGIVLSCSVDAKKEKPDDPSELESNTKIEIEIESTQFVILVQLFLLCVFLWIGYTIPAIEGNKKSIHYMPYSGGLFIVFGGLDFISFSVLITYNYDLGFIGGFLIMVGIILLLYGVLKAFYYE